MKTLAYNLEKFGIFLEKFGKNLEKFGKYFEKFGKNLEKFGKYFCQGRVTRLNLMLD